MVSPPYKGGYGATGIEAVSPDGEAVSFFSPGAFEGAPGSGVFLGYVARRTASGWTTSPEMPPRALLPYLDKLDISQSLNTMVALGKPGSNFENAFNGSGPEGLMLHATALPDAVTSWELAGGMWLTETPESQINLAYEGASPDFCHLLVQDSHGSNTLAASALLPEAAGVDEQLYELDRGCQGETPALRLVGVKNRNGSHGEPEVIDRGKMVAGDAGLLGGLAQAGLKSAFNDIAAGGREVFFTTAVIPNTSTSQLFVRLDGTRTVEVSRPLAENCGQTIPCPHAAERAISEFMGASEDGSMVYFRTKAPLVPEDKDAGDDLYLARIGCLQDTPECEVNERVVTSLELASHNPNGGEGALSGAVSIAPDGQRAYFVASGDLLGSAERGALEAEGRAVPRAGAANLYVYEPDLERPGRSKAAFIAELCTGQEVSGSVEDGSCPGIGDDSGLWNEVDAPGVTGEAQTAGPDGRYLVFSTYAQLTKDDTDSSKDVYRYDAVTGSLQRISIGEDGGDANGNNSEFDASIMPRRWGGSVQDQYELGNRAVSEDGSRVVFGTAEPISEAAINGLSNVYEWHEQSGQSQGSVSLISSGTGSEAVKDVVISPQGGDIFFDTAVGLVARDTDGAPDVYDARMGEGFPVSPVSQAHCSSDACQGPFTNPAPLLVPASVPQAPGDNFQPLAKANVKAKRKSARKCMKKRGKRGGCVSRTRSRKKTQLNSKRRAG